LYGYINKFWSSILKHEEQSWNLEHTNCFENNFMVVKCFTNYHDNKEAILINPPMAGHHSNIAQTVIKNYVDNTDYAVYSIEWKAATQETKNYSIAEIVDSVGIAAFIVMSFEGEGPIHLAGLCQGGWAEAMWASLNPNSVKSLIVAGSPIDFVIDGGKCQDWLKVANNLYIQSIIDFNCGVWPGEYQLLGFKMLNPYERFFETYYKLWKSVCNEDNNTVNKWVRNNSWYEHIQDLPGKMVMEVCNNLFRNNDLINGKLYLDGRNVDLSKITCPVVAITGDDDDITLTRQCSAILDYVSTPEEHKKHYRIQHCGHIAIFISKPALDKWRDARNFIRGAI